MERPHRDSDSATRAADCQQQMSQKKASAHYLDAFGSLNVADDSQNVTTQGSRLLPGWSYAPNRMKAADPTTTVRTIRAFSPSHGRNRRAATTTMSPRPSVVSATVSQRRGAGRATAR